MTRREGIKSLTKFCQSGILEVVKYLVEVEKVDTEYDNDGWYDPIWHTITNGHYEVFKYLLEKGVPLPPIEISHVNNYITEYHPKIATYIKERYKMIPGLWVGDTIRHGAGRL